MDEKEVAEEKQQLRLKLNSERKARQYDPNLASEFNVHLAELCLANGAKRIACYLPYGEEPDTELFIDWALENEIEVLLPVSKPDGNLDWVLFDGTTSPGIFALFLDTKLIPCDLLCLGFTASFWLEALSSARLFNRNL